MKRIVLILSLVGSALMGSVVTVSALAGPTTEAQWRSSLTDCVIVAEAQTLGVSLTHIPATAASCRRFRAVIGAHRFP